MPRIKECSNDGWGYFQFGKTSVVVAFRTIEPDEQGNPRMQTRWYCDASNPQDVAYMEMLMARAEHDLGTADASRAWAKEHNVPIDF